MSTCIKITNKLGQTHREWFERYEDALEAVKRHTSDGNKLSVVFDETKSTGKLARKGKFNL